MMPNILIVDDDPVKAIAIKEFLEGLGMKDYNIVIAEDSSSARLQLKARYFDLMLLDILLPARRGSRPNADVSIDFLRQIIEDGSINAPAQIIGITADEAAFCEYADEFKSLITQTLHIDFAKDDWRLYLANIINHMEAIESEAAAYDIDVCFQVALREPEMDAIVNSLGIHWQTEQKLIRGLLYRTAEYQIGENKIRMICAHANQIGMVATTHLAGILTRAFRPRILVMTGICGGVNKPNKKDVDIGDIIVAEKTWDWQCGKWERGKFKISPDQKDGSAELVSHVHLIESQIPRLHEEYDGVKPIKVPSLIFGQMVTGSSVISDSKFHKLFFDQHRKVHAVDMECYGLYYAALGGEAPLPLVLCIKAISDLADVDKEDDYQKYCSYMSARIMFATIISFFGS